MGVKGHGSPFFPEKRTAEGGGAHITLLKILSAAPFGFAGMGVVAAGVFVFHYVRGHFQEGQAGGGYQAFLSCCEMRVQDSWADLELQSCSGSRAW